MATEHSTAQKEKRAAYYKAWRAANKEKLKADGAAYYKANKARMNAEASARYHADPQSYKTRADTWRKANKARRQEITNEYRSRNRKRYRELGRMSFDRHRQKRLAEIKEYRAKNPDKMRALQSAWEKKNPESHAHRSGLRRTRKLQAQPAWADLDAIKAIYKQASELSRLTGVKHHADHEVPLKHPLVCGLHNEFNLRVIPARENQSKGNKFEV